MNALNSGKTKVPKDTLQITLVERHAPYFLYLALISMDIENLKFRLSYFWEPISLLTISLILGSIWGALLDQGSKYQYIIYVMAGFGIWGFMTKAIDAATNVFSQVHDDLITSFDSIHLHVASRVAYTFLYFLLTLPAILVFSYIWDSVDPFRLIILPVFFSVICFVAYLIVYALGVLCFYFPDIVRLIRLVMRMALLATPVLWKVEMLGDAAFFAYFNPFFPFLDIFRSLVSSHVPAQYSLVAMIAFLILFVLIYFLVRSTIGKHVIDHACISER